MLICQFGNHWFVCRRRFHWWRFRHPSTRTPSRHADWAGMLLTNKVCGHFSSHLFHKIENSKFVIIIVQQPLSPCWVVMETAPEPAPLPGQKRLPSLPHLLNNTVYNFIICIYLWNYCIILFSSFRKAVNLSRTRKERPARETSQTSTRRVCTELLVCFSKRTKGNEQPHPSITTWLEGRVLVVSNQSLYRKNARNRSNPLEPHLKKFTSSNHSQAQIIRAEPF